VEGDQTKAPQVQYAEVDEKRQPCQWFMTQNIPSVNHPEI